MKKTILLIAITGFLITGAWFLLNQSPSEIAVSEPTKTLESDEAIYQDVPINAFESKTDLGEGRTLSALGLGDEAAPVVIHEFSSYSCGHCAHFHKTSLRQIKAEYLDTGKAQLLFSDFPLNGPAFDASIITQCLPLNRQYDYQKLIFETQADWAYDGKHRPYLIQNAQLMGLSADDAQACLDNNQERQVIAANAQQAQEVFNIASTPSFVIYTLDNPEDKTIISGAHPFEVFQEAIEKHLK